MAESSAGSGSGEGGEGGENWWSGWIQAAKEKSAQTYEYIKKDLNEFKTVCATETSSLVASTSHTLQETINADHTASSDAVKKGISNILGGITNMLTIPPEDDKDDTVLRVSSSGNLEIFDKAKARLYELQTSVQTYCTEPDGPYEIFEEWKLTFDLEAKKGEISELLVSLIEVRSIYTKLVPSAVSHADFWERYYYKVHLLEIDEKRKDELKTRADKFRFGETNEQRLEDDWDDDSPVDLKSSPLQTSHKQIENVPTTSSPDFPDNAVDSSNDQIFEISSKNEFEQDLEDTEVTTKDDSAERDSIRQTNNLEYDRHTFDNDAPSSSSPEHIAADTVEAKESTLRHAESSSKTTDAKAALEDISTVSDTVDEVPVKEKGEYMMVGSDRTTPPSSVASAAKENESSSGLDDEWDDMKAVEELTEKVNISRDDLGNRNEWESWE